MKRIERNKIMHLLTAIETIKEIYAYHDQIKYDADALANIEITGLTEQSQLIEEKNLFAAFAGEKTDGIIYAHDAIEKGAVAILADWQHEAKMDEYNIPIILTDHPRQLFAYLVAMYYGAQPDHIGAVTGTNGKTSTAKFTQDIWQKAGIAAASLGTLGISHTSMRAEEKHTASPLTTAGPVELHAQLQGLKDIGVEHIIMEASSHGLKQCRLDGVRLQAAAFTNLSHDHLDYHGSMEDYFSAKLRLFTEILADNGTLIINNDDPYAEKIQAACQKKSQHFVTYGKRPSDLQIMDVKPLAHGMYCHLSLWGEKYEIEFPLIGEFQLYNALCALGLATALCPSLPHSQAIQSLQMLKGVRGRLQQAGCLTNGASVYVDFAHTPDALAKVISSLKPHCAGKLWVLFGCGGNRDAEKRPMMGRVASEKADIVIITDDNPRHEDPHIIRQEILAYCPNSKDIPDRKHAIWETIHKLAAGDILLIAGKGHETGQIIGDRILPFDDTNEAKKAVNAVNAL